jgi:hypothetical protein
LKFSILAATIKVKFNLTYSPSNRPAFTVESWSNQMVTVNFDLNGSDQFKFWGGLRNTHKPKLWNLNDSHGNFVKGKFTLRIPYCPSHIKPVKTFTLIDTLAIISGTIGKSEGIRVESHLKYIDSWSWK